MSDIMRSLRILCILDLLECLYVCLCTFSPLSLEPNGWAARVAIVTFSHVFGCIWLIYAMEPFHLTVIRLILLSCIIFNYKKWACLEFRNAVSRRRRLWYTHWQQQQIIVITIIIMALIYLIYAKLLRFELCSQRKGEKVQIDIGGNSFQKLWRKVKRTLFGARTPFL